LNPNESLLPLGSIEVNKDWKPTSNCVGEVISLKNVKGMEKLEKIIEECIEWSEAFKYCPNPYKLDENEIFSIAIYTHDLQGKGKKEENFYFLLNSMLCVRKLEEYQKWRGYLFYLQNALQKFPPITSTVYRGIPFKEYSTIEREYKIKCPIYWSGYTSTSPNLNVVQGFAGENGIIMCIKIYSGRMIKEYSILKGEDEILLSPNTKFVVTKSVSKGDDGFFYVEFGQDKNPV